MHLMDRPIVVTGGLGFIGSNFISNWLAQNKAPIINLDKITYAGNPANLEHLARDDRYSFVKGDISDTHVVTDIIRKYRPSAFIHFAAESHVDRSIHSPLDFIATNVVGTVSLLQLVKKYWLEMDDAEKPFFRFVHVSTDEVYGSLGPSDPKFSETTRYDPRSPYSASKASSDHFVRAWHHTYGLPTLITNCSNNYGPLQFPEKLIPLAIVNARSGRPIPVYGDGLQVRDWLYVLDHCEAITAVLEAGTVGETYNIGGLNEKTNLDVVTAICALLDEHFPSSTSKHRDLITYIKDRPGHDRRYSVDTAKIARDLSWKPKESFATGLAKTVNWYIKNGDWVEQVTSGSYREWISGHYSEANR